MKKFLLTLIALVMSIGMSWADKTVYLNPAMWDAGGAVFDAYVWNDGGNSWIELSSTVTVDGNKCYKAEIPDTWEKLIFVRQDPNTRGSWDHKWNQTSDLTLADVENKVVTITNWNKSQSISTNAVTSYSVKFATGLDWNPIDAYVWKASGPTFLGDWPGAPMTATDETFTIDGVDETIYAINILTTNTAAPTNVVFNNGSGGAIGVAQTADLTFTDGKFYFLPTANPIDPTDLAARVSVIFSDYYNRNLTDPNNGWGGGPNPKFSSIEYPVIKDGHKVVHVIGTAVNGRTTTQLNSQYSDFHVKLWPKTATKFKIWDDNKYSSATTYSGTLIPGQWNDVTIEGVSFTTAYIGIELFDGDTPETEFFLDHFYFAKPPVVDNTPPVLNTASLASTNCVSAKLTLKATDETSETITYKITDTATSTVYQTTGTSGSEINYVISGLKGSTEYTFSVTAEDENGNVSAAQNVVVSTTAYPPIPSSTIDESNVITIYGQYGTGVGAVFASGDANYDMNGRTVAKSSGNNSQFNLPSPGYDVSEMDYVHYDIMSDVDTPVALMIYNDGWKGIDIDGGLTAGKWTSFNVPISFFKDECGKTMDKVTMLCLIKNVADKTSHEGFGDFAKPYPTLYIANVFFYKESPSTEVTVNFKNSIGWDKVYAYVADAEWNAISEKWPGDEITSTLTWSTTSDDAKWIIFNDGTTKTANLTFADGTEYDYGYYVVGSMNSWAKTDGYAMTRNTYCTSNVEYKLGRQDLTTTSMFKVALWNGVELSTYYPAGMRNSYGEHGEITADDTYNIFFRPNHDGGDDWFEKYIWIGAVGNLEVLGADPTTGAMVLDGTWDGGEFGTLDGTVRATSYDVTNLAATFDGGVINTAKKNALFIARADQNIGKNKVVDNGDGTYTGYNIVILDQSGDNGRDTEMNTQISPITGPVSYTRTLPRAGIYFTMVVPFDVAVPGDCNAYKATTSTSSAGVVNVTFTEVDNLEAGVPYLMHATNGGAAFNVNGLDFSQGGDQALTDGAFKATYAPVNPVPANVYVMPKGDPAVNAEFRLLAGENSYIPAFRAYLQLNGSSSKINVMIEDTDGIHAATAEQLEGIFNIYSIDGKLVRQNGDKMGLNKGVYIINGKKVVVK